MNTKELKLFKETKVSKAVLTMVIPTVISQLITVLYNIADTFFIGQTGDTNQVAAANICLPLFILLTGFANLFGIGGASLMSRCLGKGDEEKAKKVSTFSIYSSIVFALIYGILIYSLRNFILPILGSNEFTSVFNDEYLLWTVLIGAVPTVLTQTLAHLIRANGSSTIASIGMCLGALLNIGLDPLFILVFKMNIEGAALATMVSNATGCLFFIIYLIIKRKDIAITLNIKNFTFKESIPKEVLLTGLPSAFMSFLATISVATLNGLMSTYGITEAISGVGIAKKVDMVSFGIAMGMSQGVIPLIGFNYSSKDYKRMNKIIKFSIILTLIVTLVSTLVLFIFANGIVKAFINDPLTVEYGEKFQRIICVSGPFIGLSLMIITIFQSIGKKVQPMILSLLRKGGLDIPFMIIGSLLFKLDGIVYAIPLADTVSFIISIIVFIPTWKKLNQLIKN